MTPDIAERQDAAACLMVMEMWQFAELADMERRGEKLTQDQREYVLKAERDAGVIDTDGEISPEEAALMQQMRARLGQG